jgi:hypothetical protein
MGVPPKKARHGTLRWSEVWISCDIGLHGLIHVLGFVATWQLSGVSAVSPSPNLLSGP